MADTNFLIDILIAKIKKDLALSKTMVNLLTEEKIALETKNLDLLEAICNKKVVLINELNENQISRDTIQEQLGGTIGFLGLQQILTKFQLKQQAKFKDIFDELEKLLLEIKDLSEINTRITAISQAQTDRVIDIIYGRDNSVYCENAKIYSSCTSKTLVKA